MSNQPVLEIQNLTKEYKRQEGHVTALKDINLRVLPGKFEVVQGQSGSGKTTLLLSSGGLLKPDAGKVKVNGQDLYELGPEKKARFRAKKIGFVFQQFHLIPYLTVLENVIVPTIAVPGDQVEKRAREMIEFLQLSHRSQHLPYELSTGERQRVALARALINNPELILADEPTGNLDSKNADIVLGYLAEFAKSGGSVLMVTHTLKINFADKCYQLDNGELI